jgi:hypothetical protein
MEQVYVKVGPERIDHDTFVYGVKKGDFTFRVVNFNHKKLLYGKQVYIYKLILFLHILPIFILPFIAYNLNNYWILTGILVSIYAAGFAKRNIVPFTSAIFLFCVVYWVIKGFSFTQLPTILFFTAWYSHMAVNWNGMYLKTQSRRNVLNSKIIYDALVEQNKIEIQIKVNAEEGENL